MTTIKRLEIGTKTDGHRFALPAAEATTQTIVVYGGKGMGKTNFGAVFCEELAAAGRRFCFIDPVGVAWGLRHSSDGKHEGIKLLILGGRHGDLPIEPTGGAVVAEFIADSAESVLIDISCRADGTRWSVPDKIKFVTAYVTRLLERHRRDAPPLMLIIDEAARFAPQQINKSQTAVADCLAALEVLVEEGRNSGIGITLLTQRSARMAKSVSELAEAMISFRIIGPNSVDAVLDWFGEHVHKSKWDSLVEQLRKLPRGQALIVSPGWLEFEGVAAIRLRHTFDSSKTPTGTEQKLAKRARPADLEKLREQIAATVEKAEAADPVKVKAKLQTRITELEQALAKKEATLVQVDARTKQIEEKLNAKTEKADRSAATAANAELRADVVRYRRALEAAMKILVKVKAIDFEIETEEGQKALEQALAAAVKQVTGPIEKRVTALVGRVEGYKLAAKHAEDEIKALLDEKIDLTVQVQKREPFQVAADAPPRPPRGMRPVTGTDAPIDGLTEPQRVILDTVAMLNVRGITAERDTVARWIGIHPNGGSYGANLGRLRAEGYLEAFALTDKGAAAARAQETGFDAALKALDGEPKRQIVRVLHQAKQPQSREELAALLGIHPNGGSYGANLGWLRTMGLITKSGPITTTEGLFR